VHLPLPTPEEGRDLFDQLIVSASPYNASLNRHTTALVVSRRMAKTIERGHPQREGRDRFLGQCKDQYCVLDTRGAYNELRRSAKTEEKDTRQQFLYASAGARKSTTTTKSTAATAQVQAGDNHGTAAVDANPAPPSTPPREPRSLSNGSGSGASSSLPLALQQDDDLS